MRTANQFGATIWTWAQIQRKTTQKKPTILRNRSRRSARRAKRRSQRRKRRRARAKRKQTLQVKLLMESRKRWMWMTWPILWAPNSKRISRKTLKSTISWTLRMWWVLPGGKAMCIILMTGAGRRHRYTLPLHCSPAIERRPHTGRDPHGDR